MIVPSESSVSDPAGAAQVIEKAKASAGVHSLVCFLLSGRMVLLCSVWSTFLDELVFANFRAGSEQLHNRSVAPVVRAVQSCVPFDSSRVQIQFAVWGGLESSLP